jgi:hypothetical protein
MVIMLDVWVMQFQAPRAFGCSTSDEAMNDFPKREFKQKN